MSKGKRMIADCGVESCIEAAGVTLNLKWIVVQRSAEKDERTR